MMILLVTNRKIGFVVSLLLVALNHHHVCEAFGVMVSKLAQRQQYSCILGYQHVLSMSTSSSDVKNMTAGSETTATSSNVVLISDDANSLVQQAQKLREEAAAMRKALEEEKEAKLQKETESIDRWIDHLLINVTVSDNMQVLNSVEQAMELLKEGRFSQEQVNKMYDRINETGPRQSRSNISPLMELLVDASHTLDCVERRDNPNKRWSGKVSGKLRKKLFAADWNIDIDLEEKDDNLFL